MLDGPARASRHAGEDHPRSFRVARIERASACRRFLARSACAGRLTNMLAPRLSVEQRSSERSDHLPVGQIKAHFHLAASPPGPESAATAVRAETIFRRPIKLIWPVQSRRQKYSAFPKSNSVLLSRHLPLAGGAVRGRHGRGAGGAVDAMAAQRILRRRTLTSRTVKSRGPGIPTPMPPRWRAQSALSCTVTRTPGAPGSARSSR